MVEGSRKSKEIQERNMREIRLEDYQQIWESDRIKYEREAALKTMMQKYKGSLQQVEEEIEEE